MPLPHPDHVELDWDTGKVSIMGPMTKREQKNYLYCIMLMAQIEVELEMTQARLGQEAEFRYSNLAEIRDNQSLLKMFRKTIPQDDPLWREYREYYRRLWIDYYFYYGECPRSLEEWRSLRPFDSEPSIVMRSSGCKVTLAPWDPSKIDAFKRDGCALFMRQHLKEQMGADWRTRLDRKNHDERDYGADHDFYLRHCEEQAKA